MQDRAEVEKVFRAELKALLRRWNAEIELEDHGHSWSVDEVMVVDIPSIHEGPQDQQREGILIELGKYLNGDD